MGKRKRNRANGGFTLVEMLIVVAIIAVLVVVSIPLVSASLEDAREAADAANERAAKAAAMSTYLLDEETEHKTYFYKSDGTVVREDDLVGADSGPSAGNPGFDYGQSEDNKKGYVKVEIFLSPYDGTMQQEIEWIESKAFN